MTDITELTSVQKNANIHRLSRLIAYASNDELRQLAVEVEQYTDQVIEALEKAQQRIAELDAELEREREKSRRVMPRIAELESRTVTVKQYDEFQICHYGATEDYAKGYIDCQNNFSKWLTAAGINWEAK
ncbi:hypothetical protein ABLU79_20935 [Klebsiella sp. GG_Kp152]|uniref:hypothetical protein n=1 Tax=Klebsiella sp. GG_Kp152 TaxID=3153463 RepID=UPI0032B48B0D